MQLRIIARNVDLTPALRQFVERRLRFALGRFAPRVGRLLVRLTDVSGPRGGRKFHCRIQVAFVPRGRIDVAITDVRIEEALGRAATRIERRVKTELDRRRMTGVRQARRARNTARAVG